MLFKFFLFRSYKRIADLKMVSRFAEKTPPIDILEMALPNGIIDSARASSAGGAGFESRGRTNVDRGVKMGCFIRQRILPFLRAADHQ